MDNLPTFVLQLRESWKLLLIYSLASTLQSTTSPFSRRGSYLLCRTQTMWYLSVHFFAVTYCWNSQQNSVVETCSVFPPLLFSRDWEWQLRGDRSGVVLSLPSSAGMVSSRCCHPLGVRSHSGVVLGKGVALLPGGTVVGRDSYGFVFPPRVTASAAHLQPPPFNPNLMALTPALTPASPRTGNTCEHVCVRLRSLDVFTGPGLWHWLAQMWQA